MTGINAAELRNVCKVRKDFKIDNVSFKAIPHKPLKIRKKNGII